MGFDTNGNWTSDFYPETDRDESIPILASKFQKLIQTDIKSGFDNCLTRDGAGKPQADLNFNGHKITNMADGENDTDAVTKQQLDTAFSTPASEEETGVIQLATSAEALAGTDDAKAMTPKKVNEVVRTLSTITPFCANSGYLDGNGNADLISVSGATVSFKVDDGTNYKPLACTPANGQNSFALQSIEDFDASTLGDGTYVLTVDKDANVLAVPYQAGYYTYTRKQAPNTPYLWFDISTEPYKAYKYSSGAWAEFNGVPLAVITTQSGTLSSFYTLPYNQNGFKAAIPTVFEAFSLDYGAAADVLATTRTNDGYTAPGAGIIYMYCHANGYQSGVVKITINGKEMELVGSTNSGNYGYHTLGFMLNVPVAKGDNVKIGADWSSGGVDWAQFIPCRGEI